MDFDSLKSLPNETPVLRKSIPDFMVAGIQKCFTQQESSRQQTESVSENEEGLSRWWWVPVAIGGVIVGWLIFRKPKEEETETNQSNQVSATGAEGYRSHNPDDVAFF